MSGQTRYVYGTRCEPPPTLCELEEQIAALRRQVTELEHGRIAGQEAHNALATAVEQLELAHNTLVIYAESIEGPHE